MKQEKANSTDSDYSNLLAKARKENKEPWLAKLETICRPTTEIEVHEMKFRLIGIGDAMQRMAELRRDCKEEVVLLCKRLYVCTENPFYLALGTACAADDQITRYEDELGKCLVDGVSTDWNANPDHERK
jgi:hypothetical protein